MPDESGPGLSKKLPNEQASANSSRGPDVAHSVQPQPWGRSDRIRLTIWAGVGFLPPAALLYGLHVGAGRGSSVLSVRTELPTEAILVFFISLATWIVSRIEKRPLDDYGIPRRQAFGRRFWEGCVWGFVMLSAILLVLYVWGHFRIESVALSGNTVIRWALAWGVTFLAVSWTEEFAFRGYWLFSFSRRMRFWPAALVLSVVFGAAHIANHGENVLGVVQVVESGLVFCLTIRRTGNLWFAVGFHAAWDWAQTFFYGTPDSGLLGVGRLLNSSVQGPHWLTGGSAGPEGSVVTIFMLIFCALLIHFRFPKAIYRDRPV